MGISISRSRTKKCINSYQTAFPRDVWVGSGHETIQAVLYNFTHKVYLLPRVMHGVMQGV